MNAVEFQTTVNNGVIKVDPIVQTNNALV